MDDIFTRTKWIQDNCNILCIPLTASYLSICLLWPNIDLLSRYSTSAGTAVNVFRTLAGAAAKCELHSLHQHHINRLQTW
jgi:hypothetical protein